MGEQPEDREDGIDEISVKVETGACVPDPGPVSGAESAPESVSGAEAVPAPAPVLEPAPETAVEPAPALETGSETETGPGPEREPAPKRRISKKTLWTIAGVVGGLLLVCAVAAVLVARP